jgi:hypothetical protein
MPQPGGQAPSPQPPQPPQGMPSLEQRIQEQGQRAQGENFAGSPQGQQMMQEMAGRTPYSGPQAAFTGSPAAGPQRQGLPAGVQPSAAMGLQRDRQAGIPQQPPTSPQTAAQAQPGGQSPQEVLQSAPKGANHQQKLQHLNKNAHRLDPQSRQKLEQINRAYKREQYGLKPEGAGSAGPSQRGFNDIPDGNFNIDRSRGSSQSPAGAAAASRPEMATASPAATPRPASSKVAAEPQQRSQERSGRQGKRGKQTNPLSAASKILGAMGKSHGDGKAPHVHIPPFRPIKRFHAKKPR